MRRSLLVVFVVAVTATGAFTAATTVPESFLDQSDRGAGANDLKPSECASIVLSAVVAGSVTVTGGSAAELLVGSSAVDAISGNGGDDCLVGGDGADTLTGGTGTDVCIGGAGTDLFIGCETQIQ